MDILTMLAQAQPDAPALIDAPPDGPPTTITLGELEEKANRLANAMSDAGVAALDKVTTVGYNAPEQVVTGAGVRKLTAVGVPMNYRLKPAEIAYQLNDSESVAIFCGPEHVDAVESVRTECSRLRLCVAWGRDDLPEGWTRFGDLLASGGPDAPQVDAGIVGPTMTYTAGTTGNPKGAYRAKGVDPSILSSYIEMFDLRAGDVHLVAGPLYHSAPAAFALVNTVLGGPNVLMRRFDPEHALRLIAEHRVTTTFMAPTLLQRIVDLPDDVKARYDLSSMRVIIVAAAPCPFELKRRVMELFGEVLYEFYGSSEAGVNTLMRPEEQLAKPGSCGRVAPGNEIRILDDEGKECAVGEPGEIFIRSPAVITEYYGKPEATKESWRDDYFTVGDVGYFDADGYLYIVDRKRDMVISGGVNIYCAEIEHAIHAHPKVWDVAVFGVPDDEWGERVHAIVQPKEGEALTSEEIAEWVAERLADYKKPRSVEFRDELPRDEAGKIRKRELREPYWKDRQTRV